MRAGPSSGASAIKLAELERAVAAAEPSAVLVPGRLLRRVILRDRGEWFSRHREPRHSSYVIAGPALASIVNNGDLHWPAGKPWPPSVILVLRPDLEDLATSTPEAVLLDAWRRLFRARVRVAVQGGIDRKTIDVAARIGALGRTEFEEVRLILHQDGLIGAEESDGATYVEFASLYLEQSYFTPRRRPYFFPTIEDVEAVTNMLASDADGSELLAATRPPGAPEPTTVIDPEPEPHGSHGHDAGDERPVPADEAVGGLVSPAPIRAKALQAKAQWESSRGNVVGAAILWERASRLASPSDRESDHGKAIGAIEQLARRIQSALFLRVDEADEWAAALTPLISRAAGGFWAPEARLLYDLQKVCLDHERETFRLSLVRWVLSLGRVPLKTPLPHLRDVAMSNHLRGAVRRLPKIKLARADLIRLEGLLRPAVHNAEHVLRDRFRPRIVSTLEAHWVRPSNLPERVAFDKLVEELLDQIVRHGYLSLGDLRDGASRSNLKLPDLAGASEFFDGGRLLKTDRALAQALDGVHRRGEVLSPPGFNGSAAPCLPWNENRPLVRALRCLTVRRCICRPERHASPGRGRR